MRKANNEVRYRGYTIVSQERYGTLTIVELPEFGVFGRREDAKKVIDQLLDRKD
jgi:hypothetical protein